MVVRCARWAALLAVCAGLLTGCGQKGPLYLPDHNAAVVTRSAPAAHSQSGSSSSSQRSSSSRSAEPDDSIDGSAGKRSDARPSGGPAPR